MKSLKVISGSGEIFSVSIPENGIIDQLRYALELIGSGNSECGSSVITAALEHFFPRNYRTMLCRISSADAFKLGSALVELFDSSGADPLPEETDRRTGHESISITAEKFFPQQNDIHDEKISAAPESQDHGELKLRPYQENKQTVKINTGIIAVAFAFKWTLEYTASLPPEILQHCMDYAGIRSVSATTHPIREFSPEEIRSAIDRNREVRERFRSGKEQET